MKQTERGFLLLTSHLGDPESKPLTVAQFRTLVQRMKDVRRKEENRHLQLSDLLEIGYGEDFAQNILKLLNRQELLDYYVNQAGKWDCYPITRNSEFYPAMLRKKLGADCPGCLWAKGDSTLLRLPAVSLVGSRELMPDNENFAREVGRQAALQGYVLISGNARGADQTAQESCLEYGGQVISIVSDSLQKCRARSGVLYLSEDGWNCGFSTIRAHSRNRLIHAMGEKTFVAGCSCGRGGTWSGTVQNLKHQLSPVYCYQDSSQAVSKLTEMGAQGLDIFDLTDFSALQSRDISFLD